MANAHDLLMAQRASMMGWKPYLRRVAYLESHGTEWIDTGLMTGNGVSEFITETEIAFNTSGSNRQLTGADNMQWIGVVNGRFEIGSAYGTQYEIGKFYQAKNVCYINASGFRCGKLFLDGTEDIYAPSTTTSINNNHQLIFNIGGREVSTWSLFCTCKIKFWRLTRDGVVVFDSYPVLDLSGRPAMYDDVSGQLFYNQGTGEFTWGELDAA